MNLENKVKDFYSQLNFPGTYSIENIKFYDEYLCNRYLQVYNNAVLDSTNVLDVGCGSGFIINLLAYRNPGVKFHAVDFSNSIDYAKEFSRSNNITNIEYYKQNFLDFDTKLKFETIISNGVLHHIPEYKKAIEKLKSISCDNTNIVIGIYNKYGKIFKKFIPVQYTNCTLEQDQNSAPYETSFSNREFRELFNDYRIISVMPSIHNRYVDLANLLNYKNGGLTVYTITK
jgi:2-polyprenyl-3-methyl-5-hydroxy-6-metoxy-1,4-benzoquinol methylase